MSKFANYQSDMTDQDCVVDSLVDQGYKREDIEVHETAQHLYGYQGDKRKETANIIVRRKAVGGASNDIGFKREENGTYTGVISAYDRNKHNEEWMNGFRKNYLVNKQSKEWKAKGFTNIQKEVVKGDNGRTRFRLTAEPPKAMVQQQAGVGFTR